MLWIMRNRIYLSLLVLCCIFSQVISFSQKENNEKSSNLLVRKKRLLDKTPGGDQPVPLERVPYIVSIIRNNRHHCAGTILSSNIVITAAHCVLMQAEYHVFSGSANENRGTQHVVTGDHFFPGYSPARMNTHDLVLLTIYPFINFERSPNRPIKLLNRHMYLDMVGTVSGWGSNTEAPNHRLPGSLRSITLPMVGRIMCQQYYNHNVIVIDDTKFCAMDLCDQKACGPGDAGDPFVVDGYLAGIQSMSGKNTRAPEVFVNLNNRQYYGWIQRQIERHPPNEHDSHEPLITDERNRRLYLHPMHPQNQRNNTN